ncbi:MAG: hypothetical protein D4R65_11720 [Verrucomicrobiaceae bacterium]|nr:MAG: hypothetical protein D4R65_11720 [Verrucomicrobiaceae bacterium]
MKTPLLGLLILTSLLCNAPAQSPPPPPGESGGKCPAHPHKGELAEKLGLTEEQKSKIAPVVEKNHADIKAIKDNTNLTKDQKHEQIAALHQTLDQTMQSVLTPEQKRKWEEIKSQRKQHEGGDHSS